MVPPAEAPGSLSPARPRTPPRTCSGLRPPEEGRAQASRKVRERGVGWGELDRSRGQGAPQRDPRRARHAQAGRVPVSVLQPPFASPALSCCACPPDPRGSRRLPRGRGRPRLEAAGRGGRAWFLRAVAQPPGSRTWAEPPLAKVAQRLFPATEVLFSLRVPLPPPLP